MKFPESVKNRLPKQGRPRQGEARVTPARFSLTVPSDRNKQLEVMAAAMGTNRHALASALIVCGLELLMPTLKEKGELPDAVRMV